MKKKSIYQRIVLAAERGTGVRLSREDVRGLVSDPAIRAAIHAETEKTDACHEVDCQSGQHRWSGWTMQMTSQAPGGGCFYARFCRDCEAMERGEVGEGRGFETCIAHPVPYHGDPDEALPGGEART